MADLVILPNFMIWQSLGYGKLLCKVGGRSKHLPYRYLNSILVVFSKPKCQRLLKVTAAASHPPYDSKMTQAMVEC